MRRSLLSPAILLLVVIQACGGHAVAAAPPLQTAPATPSATESLAAGDVLQLRFPHRPGADVDLVVRLDGQITAPYIGSVQASDRPVEAVEAEIRTRLDSVAYEPARDTGRRRYLINVGDQLEIRFQDATHLNSTVPVRPDGRISLPLVKGVVAEGKSPEELETDLILAYRKLLKVVDLVVMVREYTSQRTYVNGRLFRPGIKDVDGAMLSVKSFVPRQVFVAGEVRSPGFVAYRPGMSSLEAIMAAGGPLRSGRLNDVMLLRRPREGAPIALRLDLGRRVSGGAVSENSLAPFDIIVIPKKGIAKFADALDQYLYQLVPATRNINFTYFYDVGGRQP